MADPQPTASRRVAVFREAWLLGSETFIRNQIASLQRWKAQPIGMKKVHSPLADDGDLIAAPTGVRGRIARVSLRWFGRSRRLEAALRELKPDLIHAHFARDAIIIAPIARRLRIPLVVTLHGSDITALPNARGLAGWRYRRSLRTMFAQAAQVVAVSEFIKREAQRFGAPPEKTAVAYIGVPIRETPKRTAYDPQGTCEILFLGRLVEKKGVRDAIAAIAGLPASMRQRIHFTVAGDGPLRRELEEFATAQNVRTSFLGAVDASRAQTLMASSDIFLAPSKTAPSGDSEGFGMVFAEAAANVLPVVSYDHGGVPEAVAHNHSGILAPEGDIAGLTRALRELIDDPELGVRLGQAGAARVTESFDCAQLTIVLESIYDEAADMSQR